MTAFLRSCGTVFWLRRCRLTTTVLVFCLSGCAGWNVRDEGFRDNDLSQSVRKARPEKASQDKDINYWSFDERGRQIERDLHAM